MGIFDRGVSTAKIVGDEMTVLARVGRNLITYVAGTRLPEQLFYFGPFEMIRVEGNTIQCGSSLFAGRHTIYLDVLSKQEIFDAIDDGDVVRAYTLVLNAISFEFERKLRGAVDFGERFEADTKLSIVNSMKHKLHDSAMVCAKPASPSGNRGRLAALVRSSLA